MHAVDGGAVCAGIGAADGVVKDVDASCAGDGFEKQLLDFGVVVFCDGVIVSKVGGLVGGGHVLEDLEGVAVEAVF